MGAVGAWGPLIPYQYRGAAFLCRYTYVRMSMDMQEACQAAREMHYRLVAPDQLTAEDVAA